MLNNNLLVVTRYPNWPSFLEDVSNRDIDPDGIKFWYESLLRGEYPKESVEVRSFIDGKTKTSFLFNDSGSPLCVTNPITNSESPDHLKLTSVPSLRWRFFSHNLRGESPMEYLNRHGEDLIKSLYDAVLVAHPNMSEDEAIEYLRANLIKFVAQFMNERKMLVNTFPYWRVWSIMSRRLERALEVIANGGDIKLLLLYCGMYDPTAGWGDRLASVLLIKGYLLTKVRESGKYCDADVEWFNNSQFYVGCDTNPNLQSMYEKTIKSICDYFDMSYSSAIVYCENCISTRGISIAVNAARNGITVMQTSIPTPWEIYGIDLPEGDSMMLADFQGHVDPNKLEESQSRWMNKFLYPFMTEVASIFSGRNGSIIRDGIQYTSEVGRCAYIHADGYTVKYTDGRGRNKTFTYDIGGDIMSVFGNFSTIFNTNANPPSEICFGWDSAVKDKKCKCRVKACRKCSSCMNYGVCDQVPCNQSKKCYSFILRSCYCAGTIY